MMFMDAANNKPTDKTAKPLDGWIEVFKAGTHTAMNGAATAFTADDLDQMVANHAVQAAPAVIGHPQTNDPAVGWVDAVKREGNSLFAKFKDWNAAFMDAVATGAYRNRSVSVSKGDAGWALNHVGWLGAKLPAVKGMAGLYAANPDALCFETPCPDMDLTLNPSYSTGDPTMITAEQLADAVAQATAAGKAEGAASATAQFAAASDAIVQENAALKAAASKAAIDAKLDAWTTDGKMLPASRAGHAAFMAQLASLPVTCAFAVGDADDAPKHTPAEYFAAMMDAKAPVINLRGAGTEGAGDGITAPETDPQALAAKAKAFVASEAIAGRAVTLTQAIAQFSTPA